MRYLPRSLFGLFTALFLASTIGITPVLAQDAEMGGPPPPPPTPSVNVTDNCTVTDTAGNPHSYTQTGQFLGICALAAAKDQGAVGAYTLQNFSFGLFLQSLNGTAPGATEFWNIYQNGTEASVGLSDMTIATGDTLKFQLTDFTNSSQIGSPVIFQIGTLTATPVTAAPASPSGGSLLARPEFDIPLAISYLAGGQRADGSFSSALLSDWAAIAFAGGGAGDAQERLRNFFASNPPELKSVTDYERHATALQALGINPYSALGIDYILPIVNAFDQTQVGDPALVNDDIFALIPLMHAGYGTSDEIIQKVTAFILSKQSANGSWEGSVDMTAAAIQALAPLGSLPNVTTALSSAKDYLHTMQQADGGFGSGKSNVSSTSWAIQAIYALGDGISNWTKNTLSPIDYLSAQQDRDGSVPKSEGDTSSHIWATAYAIPAAERKDWSSLLSSFPIPVKDVPAAERAAATAATTTIVIAASMLADVSNTVQKLLDAVAENQKAPVNPPLEIQAPLPPPADTEATSTLPGVSPQFVQAAAVATVDYGVPFQWWKWIAAILLCIALISELARRLRKRLKSQKAGSLSEQKQQ